MFKYFPHGIRLKFPLPNPILLPLIFLGLAPLLWFPQDLVIAGGDNYNLLNPGKLFGEMLHTWSSQINFGTSNLQTPQLFPFTFFWFFLGKIGIALPIIERLWFVVLYITTGLSFYSLFSYLAKRSSGINSYLVDIASLPATALYIFNPFVMVDVITPVARLTGALFPLFVLFWIKALENNGLRYPFILGVLTVFLASSFAQPVAAAYIFISLGVYMVYHLVVHRDFYKTLRSAFFTILFSLAFNLWWILPYVSSLRGLLPTLTSAVRSYNFLTSTPIFEAFRFMGFWAFRTYYNAEKTILHVPYSDLYYHFPLVLLTYLITLTALGSFLFYRKKVTVTFFLLLGLFGVFISKGTNPPLGNFFQLLYDRLPGFSAFREPYARFTNIQVLAFAVLLGFSLLAITKRLKSWGYLVRTGVNSNIVPVVVSVTYLIIIIFISFPMLTGQVIQNVSWHGVAKESLQVKVPDYWSQLSSWLSKRSPEGKVMVWPALPYGHCYNWQLGFCSSGSAASVLLNNARLEMPEWLFYFGDAYIQEFYNLLRTREQIDYGKLFNFFGVDYVLVHNDVDNVSLGTKGVTPQDSQSIFNQQAQLGPPISFGQLDLYPNPKKVVFPKIYSPKRYLYVEGSENKMLEKSLQLKSFKLGDVFIFSKQTNIPSSAVITRSQLVYSDPILENSSTNSASFKWDVSREGAYDLLLRKNKIILSYLDTLSFFLDGYPLLKNIQNDEGKLFLDLGNYQLEKRTHNLTVKYPFGGNAISTEGFINGSYNPQENYWRLPEPPNVKVGFIILENYTAGVPYRVSFWYRNIRGRLANFGIQQNNCQMPTKKSTFDGRNLIAPGCNSSFSTADLPESPVWKYLEATVDLLPETKTALVFFELDSNQSVVDIKDITALPDLQLSFTTELSDQSSANQISTLVAYNYKKINPAKYIVFLSDSAKNEEIIFNESFHDNWKIYPAVPKRVAAGSPWETLFLKALPEKRHFLANGYANGWELKNTDFSSLTERQLIIEYQPEKLYVVGLTILAISFLTSLVYILLSWYRLFFKSPKEINGN